MEEESLQNLLKINKTIDEKIKFLEESRKLAIETAEESIYFINNYLSLWRIYETKDAKKTYFVFICAELDKLFVFEYFGCYGRKNLVLKAMSRIYDSSNYLLKFDEFVVNLFNFIKEDKENQLVDLIIGKKGIELHEYLPYSLNYFKFDSQENLFVKYGSEKYSYRKRGFFVSYAEYDVNSSVYEEEDIFCFFYPSEEIIKNMAKCISTHKRMV